MSELNSQLQHLASISASDEDQEESKSIMVKGKLNDFIKKSTQSNIDREEIQKSLAEIYGTELLLSKELYEWAQEKIAAIPQASKPRGNSPKEQRKVEEPLFCEDTVYHASLCCVAVSTKDVNNYDKFFDRDFPNHQFQEASISCTKENVDRYLIARKSKTYFIAFRSEPNFSRWPQLFESFEHGN